MATETRLKQARSARAKGCKKCVWFHRLQINEYDESSMGSCQVGAPRATSDRKWPTVHQNAWCGEWRPLWGEDEHGLWEEEG